MYTVFIKKPYESTLEQNKEENIGKKKIESQPKAYYYFILLHNMFNPMYAVAVLYIKSTNLYALHISYVKNKSMV